jgi:antitoxin ParD1/3/4
MPSQHTLTVALTAQLREFIAAQIASGRFRTASEVVRAALRLLEREEQTASAAVAAVAKAGQGRSHRSRAL